MRASGLALASLLAAMLLAPSIAAEDFAAVGKVTKLITVRETPQLAPGDSGKFVFYFNSTYTEPIRNFRLNVSIYLYATIEESVPVDGTWPYTYPKFEESGTREWVYSGASLGPGTYNLLNFTVLTAVDMPHGSVFSQATYFLRFWLEFDAIVNGNLTRFTMASRGFFTKAQWDSATNESNTNPCNPPWCRGNLNLTYLTIGGRAVDGLLPDSSFGVKEPIPQWPFYVLAGAAGGFLVLAFLFWVEENPGTYPGVEAWWARTRGRFARFRRIPKRSR